MDIIITGVEDAQLSKMAWKIVKGHEGPLMSFAAPIQPDSARHMAQIMRETKPNVMLFYDSAFKEPNDLLVAVEAVKMYRETTGRNNVLAVYMNDGAAVMITNGAPVLEAGGFKDEKEKDHFEAEMRKHFNAPKQVGELSRTQSVLLDLWEKALALNVIEVRAAMYSKIKGLNSAGTIVDLNTEQRIELHGFLLDLINEYENK